MKCPWWRRLLVLTLVFCHLGALRAPAASPMLLTPKEQGEGNVREYFSSNRDKRFLIRVHIWGDVQLSGVHYLPDNTTLLDAIGYAGGPTGVLSKSEIVISRMIDKKDGRTGNDQKVSLDGNELVQRSDYRDMLLRNGDVIHMDSPAKTDNFMRTLSIVSTSLSILIAITTIYLVAKR